MRNSFYQFWALYPEWLQTAYFSIERTERRRRIELIFGDVPLAVEPTLSEIPLDIYPRLLRAIAAGKPPLIQGRGDVDLILLKVFWNLPLEHTLTLIGDYLRVLRAHRCRSSSPRAKKSAWIRPGANMLDAKARRGSKGKIKTYRVQEDMKRETSGARRTKECLLCHAKDEKDRYPCFYL